MNATRWLLRNDLRLKPLQPGFDGSVQDRCSNFSRRASTSVTSIAFK
jgi:hypothetical protein